MRWKTRSSADRAALVASLDVRVEAADALRLRKAIVLACGDRLRIIQVARVLGSSRLCISVGMQLEAFAAVINAIAHAAPLAQLRHSTRV
jgi:hypothetical protein